MRRIGRLIGFCGVAASLGACTPMIQFGAPGGDFRLGYGNCSPLTRTARSTQMYVAQQRVSQIQMRMMMGNNADIVRRANAKQLATGECR